MANTYGVIVAGGIGSRMGCKDKPKQFMLLDGKPIIIRTIAKFCEIEEFKEIIVLCPVEWVAYTEDLVREYLPECADDETTMSDSIDKKSLAGDSDHSSAGRITVIPGGDTRNETIMCAIDHIDKCGDLDEDTVIVTHDSVRPFVTEDIIRKNIAYALGEAGADGGSGYLADVDSGEDARIATTDSRIRACTTAIPATDTILVSGDGESISEMPDRTQMYQCQTPQTFPALKLRRLYESLSDEERDVLTDAARIFLMKGERVHLIDGDISNIKITYPYDMIVAEAVVKDTRSSDGKRDC
ncbi:MAG: 2-C-methyl-D-erythritol 4-phosphate cytidylyltransferase [Eubacterium sp.]|nr:2-C-methyl-D-erythritol 4-phosphate cytidylyltransferase [Eubacterium sp.]